MNNGVDPSGPCVVSHDGSEIIAYLGDLGNDANSNLIAAAPTLLTACERVLKMLTHLTSAEYARGADREMRGILTAALTLAKGE